ncbi:MAG: hypothetical protein A3F18_03405 [Legionellales bacterium RIFCSPHIGHO2_12_FULL_37_14]|nr:MAG: hypothetical protein A3F18_03405 [Legionellales bacterium RIFCSPHIGHO2_12_FULL_37_14]
MDWEVELISLYLFVCKHYEADLSHYCLRMTNYASLQFSDAEAITLPGYKAFDYRLNQLHDVFAPLVERICAELAHMKNKELLTGLTDSMPIIMAQRGRRFHAKVAPEIASN